MIDSRDKWANYRQRWTWPGWWFESQWPCLTVSDFNRN